MTNIYVPQAIYICFSRKKGFVKENKTEIIIVAVMAIVAVFAITLGTKGSRTSTMVGEAATAGGGPPPNLLCTLKDKQGSYQLEIFCPKDMSMVVCCDNQAASWGAEVVGYRPI